MSGNREAVEVTLSALESLGRLEEVDAALVALCRSTAAAVDESPGRATLIKEYRDCLVLLAGAGEEQDADAFAELMADIHAGAEVGDPPPA